MSETTTRAEPSLIELQAARIRQLTTELRRIATAEPTQRAAIERALEPETVEEMAGGLTLAKLRQWVSREAEASHLKAAETHGYDDWCAPYERYLALQDVLDIIDEGRLPE